MLDRTCPACGYRQAYVGAPTDQRCRSCDATLGKLTFGLDHDPAEPTAADTEAERDARFRAKVERWRKEDIRTQSQAPLSPAPEEGTP